MCVYVYVCIHVRKKSYSNANSYNTTLRNGDTAYCRWIDDVTKLQQELQLPPKVVL